MRISDWSSDVCSSDLLDWTAGIAHSESGVGAGGSRNPAINALSSGSSTASAASARSNQHVSRSSCSGHSSACSRNSSGNSATRSEEHTSELQSLMRISYAVFCLKKKTKIHHKQEYTCT